MARRSDLSLILIAASSFIGGFAAGLLLAPKSGEDNRRWIADNVDDMADWVEHKSKETLHRGEEELNRFRENVREGVRRSVPDLYDATENIDLNEDDFLNE